MIDEIVLTNKIEGVHSSRREISDVLDELHGQALKKNKAKRFQGIVTLYFKLMSKEQIPTDTCLDIRNLYNDLVLPEVQAENKAHVPDGILFRKDPVDVYNIAGKTIHNGVYPESKINETMERRCNFCMTIPLMNCIVPAYFIICLNIFILFTMETGGLAGFW